MDTKEVLNISKKLDFTLKSIWIAICLFVFIVIGTCWKIGFATDANTISSVIIMSVSATLLLGYCCIIFCLYKKLPKNKNKNKIGILFIINTHGNVEDYKTIKEKFGEYFANISKNKNCCQIAPIILTQKQVFGLKNTDNEKNARKIMRKTNCIMFVNLTPYDFGSKSKKYQLQISARVFYPQMNKIVERVFSKNVNTIFSSLYVNEIDRECDLKTLQILSQKLFYVCQIVFAVVNEYTGHFSFAKDVYKQLINKLQKPTDKFYAQIQDILYLELYSCCKLLLIESYYTYVTSGKYDATKMLGILSDIEQILKRRNNDDIYQCYYTYRAVHEVLTDQFIDAHKSVEWLNKKYPNMKKNERSWAYSDAFLFACQANHKQFERIENKYKALKNNTSQDENVIFLFMNQYVDNNPNNLGVKQALFWLVYFKKVLNMNSISRQFIDNLAQDLKACNCDDLADNIVEKYEENIKNVDEK